MGSIVQLVWNGIAVGAFYGLVGIGLAIVRGLWGILNFAQGDFMILGAYLVLMVASFTFSPIAMVVGILLTGLVLAVIARGTLHYTQHNVVNGFILSTGIGLVIENVIQLIAGGTAKDLPVPGMGSINILGASIPNLRLIFFAITVAIVFFTGWFLGHTSMGRYIRAAAQSTLSAKLVGINVNWVEFFSYVLSGMLAAVAGIGLLIQFTVTPYLGVRYLLKGMAAMLLGGAYKGVGNIGSTFIAGLALGLVECIGVTLTAAAWQDIFSYMLLYLCLILAGRVKAQAR